MYAWDISHALVTTYHPYSHSPSALTEYLKQKLHSQQAKRLGRSLPTQVESSVQLERNINSDFALATTTLDYLDRRGERNVPKRYLKDADWCEDGPLEAGYYIADSDDPLILIAVDFNFKHLQCYETSIFISFLYYWQVTLIWSPYGDASLIRSFTYW